MSGNNKEQSPATIMRLAAVADIAVGDEARTIHSREGDDEPVVGVVAIHERLKAADMLVPGSKLGPGFSDEYRRIKRPLLSNAFGKTACIG